MEHAVMELAPGRQRELEVPAELDMPAVAAALPDRAPAEQLSRSARRSALRAERPVRHRRQVSRQRADMREFQAALARWAR